MRKILAICILVTMVSVFMPAVFAETTSGGPYDIGTGMSTGVVINTDGAKPFVKCKWEGTFGAGINQCWKEDDLQTSGIQVNPVLAGDKTVYFFAICTSASGVDTIDHVYADVYHPDGTFKYQIELTNHIDSTHLPEDNNLVLQRLEAVNNNNPSIITYNPYPYVDENGIEHVVDYAEVWDEVWQQEADLWWGSAVINYCQPAGVYTVSVNAVDGNVWSRYLNNTFLYVPTVGVNYDFNSINYGPVTVGIEKQKQGDQDMDTPLYPTIRNIGNVPLKFQIIQNDMGLGFTTGQGWNVRFGAKLGATGSIVRYDPNVLTDIANILPLCTLEKLDLLILIKKANNGITSASGNMSIYALQDGTPPYTTPSQFIG